MTGNLLSQYDLELPRFLLTLEVNFSYFSSIRISLNDQIVIVLIFFDNSVVVASQMNLSAIVQCLRKYLNLFQFEMVMMMRITMQASEKKEYTDSRIYSIFHI